MVVSLPAPFLFRVGLDEPHPTPWLRVKISLAMGRATRAMLVAMWVAYYVSLPHLQLSIAAAAVTAVWAWRLLGRSPDWLPWLRWVVLAVGLRGVGTVERLPQTERPPANRGR